MIKAPMKPGKALYEIMPHDQKARLANIVRDLGYGYDAKKKKATKMLKRSPEYHQFVADSLRLKEEVRLARERFKEWAHEHFEKNL